MAFEFKSTDDLVRIALAGGGLTLDGSKKHTDDLVRIALATKTGGAKLTITGISAVRHTDDLVRIAIAAKGLVSFE